jgi:hypothetical protein
MYALPDFHSLQHDDMGYISMILEEEEGFTSSENVEILGASRVSLCVIMNFVYCTLKG